MANFLMALLKAVKDKQTVKIYFMGDYGVVIAIFRNGELKWVESTWGMGLKELRRAIDWGGGKFSVKGVPAEDSAKENVSLKSHELVRTLLSWEVASLKLPTLSQQAPRELAPEFVRVLLAHIPDGEPEPADGPRLISFIRESKDFTGFLKFSNSNVKGALFVAEGQAFAAVALKGGRVLYGTEALDAGVQEAGLTIRPVRKDIFAVVPMAAPLIGRGPTPVENVEEFVKESKVNEVHLLHVHVQHAHALGLVYREVFVGALGRTKEGKVGTFPLAILVRMKMLPGSAAEAYTYTIPK